MKEIYVYKMLIGGWRGISKEEAEQKVKEGNVCGVELEMDRGEAAEPIRITLLKDSFRIFGGLDADEQNQLMEDYLNYVEEITGMVTEPI